MFTKRDISKLLFFDIQTASAEPNFHALDEEMQYLWYHKMNTYVENARNVDICDLYNTKSQLHAEFGRITCISLGYISSWVDDMPIAKIKSICDLNELNILTEVYDILNRSTTQRFRLCGHNIKEFDIPFLIRRLLIHSLPVPHVINVMNKKPWEMNFIDTMELWQFGVSRYYISLQLLARVLQVATFSTDIDPITMSRIFWDDQDFAKITKYCEHNILTTMNVILRISNQPMITAQEACDSEDTALPNPIR